MIKEFPGVHSAGIVNGERLVDSQGLPLWDESRFVAFYEATAPVLGRYLLRLTGDRATADDVLQEAYIRLLRARLSAMDERVLRSYLFRTATRLVYDRWRKARRERRALERLRDDVEAGVRSSRNGPEASPEAAVVMAAFRELSLRERSLLWLAYVEGYDHEEVARITGVGARSVRVLLFRARQKMARVLKARGLAPEVHP